jgi:hypothetical protein
LACSGHHEIAQDHSWKDRKFNTVLQESCRFGSERGLAGDGLGIAYPSDRGAKPVVRSRVSTGVSSRHQRDPVFRMHRRGASTAAPRARQDIVGGEGARALGTRQRHKLRPRRVNRAGYRVRCPPISIIWCSPCHCHFSDVRALREGTFGAAHRGQGAVCCNMVQVWHGTCLTSRLDGPIAGGPKNQDRHVMKRNISSAMQLYLDNGPRSASENRPFTDRPAHAGSSTE